MKQQIKNNLLELSDEKYKEFHSGLCPGTKNIIGVKVPILRKYAKEIFEYDTWKEIYNEIDSEYYEEIVLQGMLIGQAKKENINIVLQYVENYIPKIENWAICDIFCAELKITKKYKDKMWNFIRKYLNSEREFEVRFALVMILDYYIDDKYIQEVFEIFNSIKNQEYYVKMALAWAVSICFIKYYDKTLEYIKSCKLDKWTYNKAIQKAIESYRITDDKKEILKKLKK